MHKPKILLALDYYDYRIHKGVAHIARTLGWSLYSNQSMVGQHAVPSHWRGDGIISLIDSESTLAAILALDVPTIDLGLKYPSIPIPRVIPDNTTLAHFAAKHFIERGFKHFIVDSTQLGGTMFEQRKAAFINYINQHSLHNEISIIEIDTHNTHTIDSVLKSVPKPCAYWGYHDGMALNFLDLALQCGYKVPDDFAVMGTDNNDLLCEGSAITLSSVDTDLIGLGARAGSTLNDLFNKKTPQHTQYTHPAKGLITRQSTNMFVANHPIVSQAISLIEQQLCQPIQAASLARELGLSQQALQRLFKTHFHLTPAETIRMMKLKKAQHYLRYEQASLKQTAYQSGFSSVDSMCRSFRQYLNTSPAKWRAGDKVT